MKQARSRCHVVVSVGVVHPSPTTSRQEQWRACDFCSDRHEGMWKTEPSTSFSRTRCCGRIDPQASIPLMNLLCRSRPAALIPDGRLVRFPAPLRGNNAPFLHLRTRRAAWARPPRQSISERRWRQSGSDVLIIDLDPARAMPRLGSGSTGRGPPVSTYDVLTGDRKRCGDYPDFRSPTVDCAVHSRSF